MRVNHSSLAPAAVTRPEASSVVEGSFPEKGVGGPKTPTGKRPSSRNSLKAGLYASTLLVRGESESEYLAFARAIVAALDVQNAVEMAIAERLASALWRTRRARRYETAHLSKEAERVEQLRDSLGERERELADCRAEIESVGELWYPRALPASAIAAAISGVLRVAKASLPYTWRDVEDAMPYPVHARVPKRLVAGFRDSICEAMLPIFERAPDASTVLSWIVQKLHDHERRLESDREYARRSYESAFPSQFILPCGEGLSVGAVGPIVPPGKVLADAEGRLDRQISRALADLKAARELRNRIC